MGEGTQVLGSFDGTVDAAGGGLVTIVVKVNQLPRVREGDIVRVTWRRPEAEPEHEHDWRFYARRPDGLADIICVAEGCGPNEMMRVAPMIVSNRLLPKYEGQFDAPPLRRIHP